MNTALIRQNSRQLSMLERLLEKLIPADYTAPVAVLSNATIGMHVRHILEFYACLESGLQQGEVCYDHRKRERLLETSTNAARNRISEIQDFMLGYEVEKNIVLEADIAPDGREVPLRISSGLQRELLYTLEHTTHHLAIIAIALKIMEKGNLLEENFGVAPSTIRSKNLCAQ